MVTKRQLGLLFILLGVGAAVGTFVIDLLGAGQFQGIGPAQQRALVAAGLAVLVGLTLIPWATDLPDQQALNATRCSHLEP